MKHRIVELGNENIIGAKIVIIRKKRGIKQKQFLAALHLQGLDMSPTMLSRLEGQHRMVRDYEISPIAKVLKMTTDQLLDVDYMPPE